MVVGMVVVVVSVALAPHHWVADSCRVMMMVGMVVAVAMALAPHHLGNLTALVA